MPRLLHLLRGWLVRIQLDPGASAAVVTGAVIQGLGPDSSDEIDQRVGELLRAVAGVQNERRQHAREKAEGSFDVGFVLRALQSRADKECFAQRLFDGRSQIRGAVIQKLRQGSRAGGADAVGKRLDHGGGVFLLSHRLTDVGGSMRVDM